MTLMMTMFGWQQNRWRRMKTTIWIKKPMVIYAGGNPNTGQAPELTIELTNPQILIDPEKNQIIILETK